MLLNCGVGKDSWGSLDSKEIKPANPKGNQPWIFIGRTDAEAEAPILWPPDAKSWWWGKTLMLERLRGREGSSREWGDRWHHGHNGHECEQAPGDKGQGSLECCHSSGRKESDTTERLNWYRRRYWIINFKVAKRLDFNFSYNHKKEVISMWRDRGVS